MRSLVFLLVLVLVGTGLFFAWPRFEGTPPLLTAPERVLLGTAPRTLALSASDDGAGLRSVRVRIESGGSAEDSKQLEERLQPGDLISGGFDTRDEEIALELDARKLGLPEGESVLVVEATDWSLRSTGNGNTSELRIPVVVDLEAPRVQIQSRLTYLRRGGSALALYSVEGNPVRDGIRVGEAFFPGYPADASAAAGSELPNDGAAARADGMRLALFAIPVEAEWPVEIDVVASDAVGNEAVESFPARARNRAFGDETIRLSENFLDGPPRKLAKKHALPEADAIANFQRVNSELRARSEAQVREVVAKSSGQRLWKGAFRQLAGSRVMSKFAEKRVYTAPGSSEIVSRARHYGFDLASTARAPITASNSGRVLWADDLGIYGRCVVIDHGLGLTTLYAHLSSIDVKVGESVERGQSLGRSGTTGLAGGDHLHFAVMLGTTYVDPLEWWDAKWIRSHIDEPLAAMNEGTAPADAVTGIGG